MEELSYAQKLLAEVLGTAMLVFVGVGSVPATLIVGGDAPFTMAQLGMISFAFAMVVVALIYAIGHISGCQINPAITLALAATRPGGLLVAFSCSGALELEAFLGILFLSARRAERGLRLLSLLEAGPDHPQRPDWPRSRYLKGALVALDR